MSDNMSAHDDYAEAYLSDYGFEQVMVMQRRRFLLALIASAKPECIVEIGCGMEPLFYTADNFSRWITVEPAKVFAEQARRSAVDDERVTVIELPAEAIDWSTVLAKPPDLVLLSSLLHEIDDPAGMLRTIHSLGGPHTLVHANVPNANSFHRRLAVSMGLIAKTTEPSARNRQLMQRRVFIAAEFRALFKECGFQVLEEGGYFLKPFTHAQMDAIGDTIGKDLLDGLYALGRELPELASEIYLSARKL